MRLEKLRQVDLESSDYLAAVAASV